MKKIHFVIITLLLSSCVEKSSDLISYNYENEEVVVGHDEGCKLLYMSKQNKKIEESAYIGQVNIQKKFFKKIPVMADEIHLLQKSVEKNLCAHAVKYVLMKFAPSGYLEGLALYK